METIRVVLDKKLLLATDRAARRAKRNRSAFIREALRERLWRLEERDKERRDRLGYSAPPEKPSESSEWEAEAAWLEE